MPAEWYPTQAPIGDDEWNPPAPPCFRQDNQVVGWLQAPDVDAEPVAEYDPPPPPDPPVIGRHE